MKELVSTVSLNSHRLMVNGKLIQANDGKNTNEWLHFLFRLSGVDYPKFYKMDALCQAAVCSVEMMKQSSSDFPPSQAANTSILISNRHSSAETDKQFINSYVNSGNPSPSLFVYTLPNIIIGELSIRHKWFGENLCFITEKFSPSLLMEYIQLLPSSNTEYVIGGWIDFVDNRLDSFIFLLKENEIMPDNAAETVTLLNKLYHIK